MPVRCNSIYLKGYNICPHSSARNIKFAVIGKAMAMNKKPEENEWAIHRLWLIQYNHMLRSPNSLMSGFWPLIT
jgi:hypothetical protein